MPFNNDFTEIIRIFIPQQYIQVYRDKPVEQIASFLFDCIFPRFEEHGTVQNNIPVVGIHCSLHIRTGKGRGQFPDHGSPDTDQIINPAGLTGKQQLLLLKPCRCLIQIRLLQDQYVLQFFQFLFP